MTRITLSVLAALLLASCAGGSPSYAEDNPMRVEYPPAEVSSRKPVTSGVTGNRYVIAAAQKHGVPVRLALAVAYTESRFNCRARNPKSGASGIMQVMPATARGLGIRGSLFDCATGAAAGAMYLRRTLNSCGGDWACAAARYEAGEFSGRRTSPYARVVLARTGGYSND